MLFFQIVKRLEEAEKRVSALEAALTERRVPPESGGEDKKPVYPLDDLKLQEGISNLMGYDPFGKKRSEL